MNLNPAAAFDANGASQGAVREIGLPLLWLALVLLPFDIGLRRLLFGNEQVAAVLRRLGREPRIKNQEPTTADISSVASVDNNHPTHRPAKLKTQHSALKTQNSDLERLREAQERARRRARGEE
jgi:hypothetical protein